MFCSCLFLTEISYQYMQASTEDGKDKIVIRYQEIDMELISRLLNPSTLNAILFSFSDKLKYEI